MRVIGGREVQRVMEFPYIRVFWAKQGMYRESVGSAERTNVWREQIPLCI